MARRNDSASIQAGKMFKDAEKRQHVYERILRNLYYRLWKTKALLCDLSDDTAQEEKILKRLSRLYEAINKTETKLKELKNSGADSSKSLGELASE